MDNIVVEVLSLPRAPGTDTRLVVLADGNVRAGTAYAHECAQYARAYHIFVASGLYVEGRRLCQALFSPTGECVLRQASVHLALSLRAHLQADDTVHVCQTPLGGICLCPDADLRRPEAVRAAALKGADIVLSAQHVDPVDDTDADILRTAWNAAQTNSVYVVRLSDAGVTVCCPASITRAGDGFLLPRMRGAVPCRFALNLNRLDEARQERPAIDNVRGRLTDALAAAWRVAP